MSIEELVKKLTEIREREGNVQVQIVSPSSNIEYVAVAKSENETVVILT